MIINEVIREASSEHEVYFLLTAYVEAVRYCDKLNRLPRQMRDLPLNSVEDVKTRFDGLTAELNRPPAGGGDDKSLLVVRETAGILRDALDRLHWLERENRRETGA